MVDTMTWENCHDLGWNGHRTSFWINAPFPLIDFISFCLSRVRNWNPNNIEMFEHTQNLMFYSNNNNNLYYFIILFYFILF